MGSRVRPSSPARAPSPARVEEALDRTVAAELPRLLPRQRWFGSKGRAIAAVRSADWARLGERGWLGLVDVAFGAGADERYLVAFVLRAGAAPRGALSLPLDLAETSVRAEDAFDDPLFCRALLEGFGRGTSVSSTRGRLRFVRGDGAPTLAQAAALVPRRLSVEQSNTSVVYGDRFVLKALRRVEPGESLDYEIGAFLTSRVGFAHVPPVAGAIEYVPAAGPAATLAILQRYVPNHGGGWEWALEQLRGLRDVAITTRARPGRARGRGLREDPDPRRLPSRPDTPHRRRLRHPRLRGRARPPAGGAAVEAVAPHGRGGDAALIRLCGRDGVRIVGRIRRGSGRVAPARDGPPPRRVRRGPGARGDRRGVCEESRHGGRRPSAPGRRPRA